MESLIKDYLNMVSGLFTNGTPHKVFYSKLLKYGEMFPVENVKKYGRADFPVKQRMCFRNAILLSLHEPQIDYVQGFYMPSGIPLSLEHAFNLRGGKIIDTTAEMFNIPVDEYFGVVIPNNFVMEYFRKFSDRPVDMILNYYLETLEL